MNWLPTIQIAIQAVLAFALVVLGMHLGRFLKIYGTGIVARHLIALEIINANGLKSEYDDRLDNDVCKNR